MPRRAEWCFSGAIAQDVRLSFIEQGSSYKTTLKNTTKGGKPQAANWRVLS